MAPHLDPNRPLVPWPFPPQLTTSWRLQSYATMLLVGGIGKIFLKCTCAGMVL